MPVIRLIGKTICIVITRIKPGIRRVTNVPSALKVN
ncbi:hypothetical protein BMETH_2389_0 [methanotrophic bacterial endosymbiont of Bathymodiolus sp.]|nr:hypothetical protein BMETH_2389_0 [methanotrophic bacterial endosymbiont of Bathymodiolus sp.]